MTRTGWYKLIYFAVFGVALVGGAAAVLALGPDASPAWVFPLCLGLPLALMLPGMIQRFFWTDMLTGLRLINSDPLVSITHSRRFLGQLAQRPWLKNLIWLGTSSYSHNVEAMARNNLGGALIQAGHFDDARSELEQAIVLDPQCPLPYKNMSLLTVRTGRTRDALVWLNKATALGLKDDWSDAAVQASQARHAAKAGRGVKAKPKPDLNAPRGEKPGTFVVELFNDDETSILFVADVLEEVFGMTGIEALGVGRRVHDQGSGVCATFATQAEADDHAARITAMAREAGHPLVCTVRPAKG